MFNQRFLFYGKFFKYKYNTIYSFFIERVCKFNILKLHFFF